MLGCPIYFLCPIGSKTLGLKDSRADVLLWTRHEYGVLLPHYRRTARATRASRQPSCCPKWYSRMSVILERRIVVDGLEVVHSVLARVKNVQR